MFQINSCSCAKVLLDCLVVHQILFADRFCLFSINFCSFSLRLSLRTCFWFPKNVIALMIPSLSPFLSTVESLLMTLQFFSVVINIRFGDPQNIFINYDHLLFVQLYYFHKSEFFRKAYPNHYHQWFFLAS